MLKNVKIKKKKKSLWQIWESQTQCKVLKNTTTPLPKGSCSVCWVKTLSEVNAKPKNKITSQEVSCNFLKFKFFSLWSENLLIPTKMRFLQPTCFNNRQRCSYSTLMGKYCPRHLKKTEVQLFMLYYLWESSMDTSYLTGYYTWTWLQNSPSTTSFLPLYSYVHSVDSS